MLSTLPKDPQSPPGKSKCINVISLLSFVWFYVVLCIIFMFPLFNVLKRSGTELIFTEKIHQIDGYT